MAYLQTSASSTDDLMSTITSFMASNGYTVIRSQAETIQGVAMTTTTMQCPDGTYVTFISTNTITKPYPATGDTMEDYYQTPLVEDGGYSYSHDDPARGAWYGRYVKGLTNYTATEVAQFERPWLGAIRHITYDASKDWIDQPDAKRFYQDDVGGYYDVAGLNRNAYCAIVAGADIPNVWVFINTNPDCVHIVTEYKGNHYSHMTIGNLEKSHSFVGGEYIVGSCNGLDGAANYMGYIPQNTGNIRACDNAQLFFGGVRCEGDGSAWYNGETVYAMKGWGRVYMTTGIHVARSDNIMADISDADGLNSPRTTELHLRGLPCAQGYTADDETYDFGSGDTWLASTFDHITGQAAPIPLTSWCEHEATGAVYLGSWVHVGVIQMGALTGKEELTIGTDTYMVFPLSTLIQNCGENTVYDGIDHDGSLVYDSQPSPEAHSFGLGLAIRKTV